MVGVWLSRNARPLLISVFLCGSAVIMPYFRFTAEAQRNAEIRKVQIRA
jgi:hypothetical protein